MLYADSRSAVDKFVAAEIVEGHRPRKLQATMDPQVAKVWLVVDHANEDAWIVYLADVDFEEVDYHEAVRRYFIGR